MMRRSVGFLLASWPKSGILDKVTFVVSTPVFSDIYNKATNNDAFVNFFVGSDCKYGTERGSKSRRCIQIESSYVEILIRQADRTNPVTCVTEFTLHTTPDKTIKPKSDNLIGNRQRRHVADDNTVQ